MDDSSVGGHPIFKRWTGQSVPWGPEGRYEMSFGGDVLKSLTDGLDQFLESGARWSRRRMPGVLGCTPWLTDAEIVDRLVHFSECCVVINKPESLPGRLRLVDDQITQLHEAGHGLRLEVLRGLEEMAPKVDGKPLLVGPYDTLEWPTFWSVRVAGVRKTSRRSIPLVHAKLLVGGFVHWSDEHPSGYTEEWWSFEPRRLWFGSANFTNNARRSLEFGSWVDDVDLLGQATAFLTDLLTYSEQWGSTSIEPDPELASYDYDEEAMWEAWREQRYGEPDGE